MYNFQDFLNQCGKKANHHSLNVAEAYEGWRKAIAEFRTNSPGKNNRRIAPALLQGILTYDLSDEEVFFILSYTASFSSWVNLPLRNNQKLTDCQGFYANGLEAALLKMPGFKGDFLYRMDSPICDKEEELEWFTKQKANVIRIPNFLSVAKTNWDNTEITWRIATNRNSLAFDLDECRNNPSEDEVLYMRNSLFKIIDVSNGIILMQEVENSTGKVIDLFGNYVGCK